MSLKKVVESQCVNYERQIFKVIFVEFLCVLLRLGSPIPIELMEEIALYILPEIKSSFRVQEFKVRQFGSIARKIDFTKNSPYLFKLVVAHKDEKGKLFCKKDDFDDKIGYYVNVLVINDGGYQLWYFQQKSSMFCNVGCDSYRDDITKIIWKHDDSSEWLLIPVVNPKTL